MRSVQWRNVLDNAKNASVKKSKEIAYLKGNLKVELAFTVYLLMRKVMTKKKGENHYCLDFQCLACFVLWSVQLDCITLP